MIPLISDSGIEIAIWKNELRSLSDLAVELIPAIPMKISRSRNRHSQQPQKSQNLTPDPIPGPESLQFSSRLANRSKLWGVPPSPDSRDGMEFEEEVISLALRAIKPDRAVKRPRNGVKCYHRS